jgi:cellulose synthase operon protein C
MIFQFPDFETLRLAMSTSLVPPQMSGAKAVVSFDAQGHPAIESVESVGSANLADTKAIQSSLKKLGVKPLKAHHPELQLTVDCWPQVLPVTRVGGIPELTPTTPVLFDLPLPELPGLVTEMLRLGNDRQSYRTIRTGNSTATEGIDRALLKVIGPPYYSLLRAIDKSISGGTITASLEVSPDVWVEIGCVHPLADRIKPGPGQLLLLKPERQWQAVEAGEFHDVYDVVDFQLPSKSNDWQESQLKGKLVVPLRLVAGNAADIAEMWVIRGDADNQLDAFVRDADDRLIARLMFAVVKDDTSGTMIVLRTRPSKLPPPALQFDSVTGYKPFWKLPNLFLPVATRLMPTLRRDAVRKLLADDPGQIVWLTPGDNGKFLPESLPDDAFRPLDEWVDYVIDCDRDVLQKWIESTQFDFESFLCNDGASGDPKAPGDKTRLTSPPRPGESESPANKGGPRKKKADPPAQGELFFEPTADAAPSEWQVQLETLERKFLALSGNLDLEDRQALWQELAPANARLKRSGDAALCWLNGFWTLDALSADATWPWLVSEDPKANPVPTRDEFARDLAVATPNANDLRLALARILHATALDPVPESLTANLAAIRGYLERHESLMPMRGVWLAWMALSRTGDGPIDVLALARARDRLLNRLLAEGLNAERNLPTFLRFAQGDSGDRIRQVRERYLRVMKLVEDWHAGPKVDVNRPYMKLMFAFGLAKLGEETAARDLIREATELLGPMRESDGAHRFLLKSFLFRIENAIQGLPHRGPLPKELLASLETIDEGRGTGASRKYVVDRMRTDYWMIDPEEKTNPYLAQQKFTNEFEIEISRLPAIRESAKLEEKIQTLLKKYTAPDHRLLILLTAIPLAPRIGEVFTLGLLAQVPDLLADSKRIGGLLGKQADLLEESVFFAAHYDNKELVRSLFQRSIAMLKDRTPKERYEVINKVSRECFRSFRKLGLNEEAETYLNALTTILLDGKSLFQLKVASENAWVDALVSLVGLAEGWLSLNEAAKAEPYLDQAREILIQGQPVATKTLPVLQVVQLTQAYLTALGQAPVETSLPRIEELFARLERLPNSLTTSTHYSKLHLNVIEALVRSLISENFQGWALAARFREDDEYILRHRLHADTRKFIAKTGLS